MAAILRSFRAPLADYERQAELLLAGHRARDATALRIVRCHHPRFLRDDVPWLSRNLGDAEVAAAAFDLDDALLPGAGATERHLALALAAQLGHAPLVRLLLDAGEDPDRFNPRGAHAHATPLHHAALAGHATVVELLVTRGARLDIRDRIYASTPLGWAPHAGRREVEAFLLARGAP